MLGRISTIIEIIVNCIVCEREIGILALDLVWEVNEEILSVKLDYIVKVYLYDSAWGELRALHKITDMQIRSKRCPMQLKF
jgi:hypothetical protein